MPARPRWPPSVRMGCASPSANAAERCGSRRRPPAPRARGPAPTMPRWPRRSSGPPATGDDRWQRQHGDRVGCADGDAGPGAQRAHRPGPERGGQPRRNHVVHVVAGRRRAGLGPHRRPGSSAAGRRSGRACAAVRPRGPRFPRWPPRPTAPSSPRGSAPPAVGVFSTRTLRAARHLPGERRGRDHRAGVVTDRAAARGGRPRRFRAAMERVRNAAAGADPARPARGARPPRGHPGARVLARRQPPGGQRPQRDPPDAGSPGAAGGVPGHVADRYRDARGRAARARGGRGHGSLGPARVLARRQPAGGRASRRAGAGPGHRERHHHPDAQPAQRLHLGGVRSQRDARDRHGGGNGGPVEPDDRAGAGARADRRLGPDHQPGLRARRPALRDRRLPGRVGEAVVPPDPPAGGPGASHRRRHVRVGGVRRRGGGLLDVQDTGRAFVWPTALSDWERARLPGGRAQLHARGVGAPGRAAAVRARLPLIISRGRR